ncbi:MAG: type II toxin-antitoxin system VapC family toxin [Blastocatellia bacterium]
MLVLVDSNILVYNADPASLFYQDSENAMKWLLAGGDRLYVTPQNLIEFWAVVTRPATARGLGMTTSQAQLELAKIKNLFRFLPDVPAIFTEWERLVTQHAVSGKNVHDTRLAAAMNVHGLTHLLTFNGSDFKRFAGITVIDPASVTPPVILPSLPK